MSSLLGQNVTLNKEDLDKKRENSFALPTNKFGKGQSRNWKEP